MSYIDDQLKRFENLGRADYVQTNQDLGEDLWERERVPTVADIAQFMSGEQNEKMDAIFRFLENKDDFMKMATRTQHLYGQDESSAYIAKVMSANNDDISQAGYFYFLLMASADDFLVQENDCKSQGVLWKKEDITEEAYNYRIRFMYINEAKLYMRYGYERFRSWMDEKGYDEIHVRTPLTCACAKNHGVCKRCAGALPNTKNAGLFTTLMVTESATQGALSSMNKGKKENINKIIQRGYGGGPSWEEISAWVSDMVEELKNPNVAARFYEIAFLSRVRKVKDHFVVAGLKGSINYSDNLFGQYIFQRTNKAFKRMIDAGSFEDGSLKLQIAVNDFE